MTNEIIYEMITENTGKHILDSGGDYGRHWQHNKKMTLKDFENQPQYFFEISKKTKLKDIENDIYNYLQVSTFYHLSNFVDYDKKTTDDLNHYLKENNLYSDMNGVSEFMDGLELEWENTFNHENQFTQNFQLAWLKRNEILDVKLIFIATHNGADVRGGYSNYKAFEVTDEMFWFWDATDHIQQDFKDGLYESLKDLQTVIN